MTRARADEWISFEGGEVGEGLERKLSLVVRTCGPFMESPVSPRQ